MPIDRTACSSELKNTSGVGMYVSYIPPHGKYLAANASVQVPGNIFDVLSARGNKKSNRGYDALLRDIEAGRITVMATPSPVLYDEALSTPKTLIIDNGRAMVVAPAWEVSLS